MQTPTKPKTEAQFKKIKRRIIFLSIVLPIAIASISRIKVEGFDFGYLPAIYSISNAIMACVLIAALIAAKKKRITLHQNLIKVAFGLCILFLILYIAYHATSESTVYEGAYSSLYYTILISHILLSAIVVPLVLFTFFYGWKGDIKRHNKWNKIAFPIWLYVAVSGVTVYLMISPYY